MFSPITIYNINIILYKSLKILYELANGLTFKTFQTKIRTIFSKNILGVLSYTQGCIDGIFG